MIEARCPSCGTHVTVPTPRNTAGRIAEIRAAWVSGARTAAEIAERVHVSRAAVLGYYHRHGEALKRYPLRRTAR